MSDLVVTLLPVLVAWALYALISTYNTKHWPARISYSLIFAGTFFGFLLTGNFVLENQFWDFSTSALLLQHLGIGFFYALVFGIGVGILERHYLLDIKLVPKDKTKITLARRILAVVVLVLLAFGSLAIVLLQIQQKLFHGIQMELMLFYLTHNLAGTEMGSRIKPFTFGVIGFIVLLVVLRIPVLFWQSRVQIRFTKVKSDEFGVYTPKGRGKRVFLTYALVVALLPWIYLAHSVGAFAYATNYFHTSSIFEKYYVPPQDVDLQFPKHKRNLVFIYSESMENTLASKKNGGAVDVSRIPELEQLAMDPANVSFTNRAGKIGGAQQTHGLGWSLAGMVATEAGIPLLRGELEVFTRFQPYQYRTFLPGAYMLGQVLKKEGYNLSFMVAADRHFGGLDLFTSEHGGWKITDINTVRADGRVPPDYLVFWGFEDKKLFKWGKEELNKLNDEGKPFALVLFTADTHEPNGYMDAGCSHPFASAYENAYHCSSKKIADFVKYVQAQPFGKDTTIVVTGDHLGTATNFYTDLAKDDPGFVLTVYKVFINSALKPEAGRVKQFTTMDMYPTILAAMGVKIPGNQLGLGVNLFSDKPTMVDIYGGIPNLSRELQYRSKYYNEKIFELGHK